MEKDISLLHLVVSVFGFYCDCLLSRRLSSGTFEILQYRSMAG